MTVRPAPVLPDTLVPMLSRQVIWIGLCLAYLAAAFVAVRFTEVTYPEPALATLVFALLLIALSVEDIRAYRLPDRLNLVVLATGLGFAAQRSHDDLISAAAAAVAGYAALAGIAWIYEVLRKRAGLGHGDAKLLGAIASWVGAFVLPSLLALAAGMALVVCLVLRSLGSRLDWQSQLPFGPFICFAAWLVWWLGPLFDA